MFPANIDKKQKGFTLMELMIVVAIVGILAAIAYPSYQSQARKTRRAEGTSELTRIMDLQERFYANNFPPTYTTDLTDLGLASAAGVETDNGYYQITATACGGGITACVLLTAAAQAAQANDGDLTLNSLGAATRNGAAGWD